MRHTNQITTKRALPDDLLFIRHGESEANVAQEAERLGKTLSKYDDIAKRADWKQRLTEKGIKQAKQASQWIKEEFKSVDNFDGCYVSPFLRARETAGYLGGSKWWVDDRIIERSRGVYGLMPYDEKEIQQLIEAHEEAPWYARPTWGESLQDVFERYRIFQDSIKRHHSEEKVIVVSHGDFIKTARYAIERLMPEDWQKDFVDINQKLPNCGIIHYSRLDPYTSQRSDIFSHFRIIYPDDISSSPAHGRWQKLIIKKTYNNQELLESVTKIKKLL